MARVIAASLTMGPNPMSNESERAAFEKAGISALRYAIEQLRENGSFVDEEGETTDALEDLLLLIQRRAQLIAEQEKSQADWLHLRDGVVVGTHRPDIQNGRYVYAGKLPSEGGKYDHDYASRADIAEQEKAEAVGVLNVSRFRGSNGMVNHDFEYLSELPDGTYSLYLHPDPPTDRVAQEAVDALPIETAPRDGSMLRLLVQFDEHATEDTSGPAWTIGSNSFDENGEDDWQFAGWCWSHDHFTEGKGTPVGWLPMLNELPAPSTDRVAAVRDILDGYVKCQECEAQLGVKGNGQLPTLCPSCQERERSDVWIVQDETGMPIYCASYALACQEHINDAINEHSIVDAKAWKVLHYSSAATPKPEADRVAAQGGDETLPFYAGDLFWPDGEGETCATDMCGLIQDLADNEQIESGQTLRIRRAKTLPTVEVVVTIDDEGDVDYREALSATPSDGEKL